MKIKKTKKNNQTKNKREDKKANVKQNKGE